MRALESMGAAPVKGCNCAAKDMELGELDDRGSSEIVQEFGDSIASGRGGALGRPVLLSREGEGMAQVQWKQGKATAVMADSVLIDEAKAQQPAAMTEEAENAQLEKKLLYDFVKRSSVGIPCIWVQTRGDQFEGVSGSYSLDAAMAQLTVQEVFGTGGEPAKCLHFALSQIKDLYSVAADGEECFPASLLAGVPPKERKRLLRLTYGDDDLDHCADVCLLVESVEALEAFSECLKLLCIAARVPA